MHLQLLLCLFLLFALATYGSFVSPVLHVLLHSGKHNQLRSDDKSNTSGSSSGAKDNGNARNNSSSYRVDYSIDSSDAVSASANSSNEEPVEFIVRQVPGDGSCLFHAIAASIRHITTGSHGAFDESMNRLSRVLRLKAVGVLSSCNTTLYMERDEIMSAGEMLEMTANHYELSSDDYCTEMLKEITWGGGPEIVALCHYLHRPIFVYEVHRNKERSHRKEKVIDTEVDDGDVMELKVCARFGYPRYQDKSPLYLLYADGRFPDLPRGSDMTPDHFLALFPAIDVSIASTATTADAATTTADAATAAREKVDQMLLEIEACATAISPPSLALDDKPTGTKGG